MAGFTKVYFVGSGGGFIGGDGVARPFVQILVGESDRMWLEPIYENHTHSPLGGVKTYVPESPDSPYAVLDAVILFLPKLFKSCPSLEAVAKDLKGREQADFHLGKVPAKWESLREEALPIFRTLGVYEAEIRRYEMSQL